MTRTRTRTLDRLALVASVAACFAALAPNAALAARPERASAPPPAASYVALPMCHSPARGRVGCLAYLLAPRSGSSAANVLSARARTRTRAWERSRGSHASLLPGLPGASLAAGGPPAAEATPSAETTQQPQPVTPADLHSAYQLPDTPPSGAPQQTIALVDAYNDLSIESDLRVYDRTFGLPECTAVAGCFKQLNARGESTNPPFPRNRTELEAREATCKSTTATLHEREAACLEVEEAASWGVEIATDVEISHSICQTCRIRLLEASSAEYPALEAAERTAARSAAEGGVGATEISNSWGGEEPSIDSSAFEHPGIVITASAGDDGYLNWTEAEAAAAERRPYYSGADYPASSPDVVAVGGTELVLGADGSRQSERVWNEDPNPEGGDSGGGGGGCSTVFAPQPWQRAVPDWSSVGCEAGGQPRRAVADVAADGDPYSGVLVYDSAESEKYLLVIGGTSVASPIIASTFALAGGAGDVAYPAQTLYSHLGSGALYDVTTGGNGHCDALYTAGCSGSMNPLSPLDCGQEVLICNAATGYDGPSGVGTPNGIAAFEASGAEGERQIGSGGGTEGGGGSPGTGGSGGGDETPRSGGGSQPPTGQTQSTATGGGQTGVGSQSEGGLEEAATGGGTRAAKLTGLSLTAHARAAVAARRCAVSEVSLRFSSSAATPVRVTLARRVLRGGRWRWTIEPGAFTIHARRGRGHVTLRGRETLAAGLYRVTLAPAGGTPRAVTFALD